MKVRNRREALNELQKATITTTVAADGMLNPTQSRRFLRTVKEKGVLSQKMRLETPTAPSGELNKLSTGRRLLRGAPENTDDGYRAEATFPIVPYQTAKVRLPWEVTEDTFHENIEGEDLEADLIDEFTQQLALDIEDLEVNGDTADAGPDAAFLTINNGILKLAATVAGVHRINAQTINGGAVNKAHFFAGQRALPNKYRQIGGLIWLMSPNRASSYVEQLSDRLTSAGDAALLGADNLSILRIPVLEVPSFPDDRVLLVNPRNFVRIISWQVRRRKVTGETDWELATRDKRGYIFFLKHDVIIEEPDALVDIYGFDPVV